MSITMTIKRALLSTELTILMVITGQAHAQEAIVFYHNDLLGSPVAATDQWGNLCWREDYTPCGNKRLNDDSGCGLDDNQRGYTGHVHDEDIGLTYAQARYYDPVVGRFYGIDPVPPRLSIQPTFSRYAYGNNNPYKFRDPDGKSSLSATDIDVHDVNPLGAFGDIDENGVIGGGILGLGLALALSRMLNEQADDDDDEADKSAAETLGDFTGKTRDEADQALKDAGFTHGGTTPGGYDKYGHPDGSRVQIRPDGEVVRTAPKVQDEDPNKAGHRPRVGPDGRIRDRSESHSTGEVTGPAEGGGSADFGGQDGEEE